MRVWNGLSLGTDLRSDILYLSGMCDRHQRGDRESRFVLVDTGSWNQKRFTGLVLLTLGLARLPRGIGRWVLRRLGLSLDLRLLVGNRNLSNLVGQCVGRIERLGCIVFRFRSAFRVGFSLRRGFRARVDLRSILADGLGRRGASELLIEIAVGGRWRSDSKSNGLKQLRLRVSDGFRWRFKFQWHIQFSRKHATRRFPDLIACQTLLRFFHGLIDRSGILDFLEDFIELLLVRWVRELGQELFLFIGR